MFVTEVETHKEIDLEKAEYQVGCQSILSTVRPAIRVFVFVIFPLINRRYTISLQ